MKQAFYHILCCLLVLLMTATGIFASTQYSFDEIGLSIEIPDRYYVYAMGKKNEAFLRLFEGARAEEIQANLSATLKENDGYLVAFTYDMELTITIYCLSDSFSQVVWDFSSYDDLGLEENMRPLFKEQFQRSMGYSFAHLKDDYDLDLPFFRNQSGIAFYQMRAKRNALMGGTEEQHIFITVHEGKSYMIVMYAPSVQMLDANMDNLRLIADSLTLYKPSNYTWLYVLLTACALSLILFLRVRHKRELARQSASGPSVFDAVANIKARQSAAAQLELERMEEPGSPAGQGALLAQIEPSGPGRGEEPPGAAP